MPAAYLTQRDVCQRYSISRTTLWAWRQAGGFPEPVHLGPSPTLRWRLSALEAWEARAVPAAQADPVSAALAEILRRLDALQAEVHELRPRKPNPRPFLSLREAARRLGVSRGSTLLDMIRDRRIRTTKVNGRVKVPAAEVERIIREASR